ncbi:CDT1-like protein a, chloroplastic [Mercurialis annua]|uniref:CDT1-like protein a, chloroplastic n=1 Tax=Mercurialis annua TaxID=3986 RepID=UPI00215EFDAB|nr:CDT1-like protein a, chloroplastic [Mercurialis annua]
MSSSRSSSIPFKSKKPIQSAATPKTKSKLSESDPIATQTPDKQPAELPSRRLRNRGVALSVKEVRKIAQGGGNNNKRIKNEADQLIRSARRQISTWPEETSSCSSGGSEKKKIAPPELKIPAKYAMLIEFYNSLDNSIRLLKLKGSAPTFTNISPKIQCLTDRRFSYGHLAQLKYLMPEAIEIKRVLTLDERSSCMKPDLHVSLNVNAIECVSESNLKSESKHLQLRKVFLARLEEFVKAHPEGDEVPEELLPEPFNRTKLDLSSDETKAGASSSTGETSTDEHTSRTVKPAMASHFSRSFTRRFSQRSTITAEENNCSKPSIVCPQESVLPIPEPQFEKVSSNVETKSAGIRTPGLFATPCKETDSTKKTFSARETVSLESTPAKFVLTPSKLMSVTPSPQSQKRCYMTPDDTSTSLPDKLVRRPSRSRSLKFEAVDDNEINDIKLEVSADEDISKIFSDSLLQSIREKEKKAQEERDPAISQAKRRKQMIACLPKLFNMMHFLFQSIKRSVITKDELIHKIIAGHTDISDRREVEEQLELLIELVPDWISKKPASSGDLLFCVNKISSAETIRSRLEEAN